MSSLEILRILIDPKKDLYRYFAIASIYKSRFSSKGIKDALNMLVQAAVAKGGFELNGKCGGGTYSFLQGILNQERLVDET